MKYVKMLGLLAVAAAALMAFAGTASATTVTSSSGTTPTIEAASESATSLHNAFTTITCQKSTVKGAVEKHGAGVTVSGKISTLTFTECGANKVTVKNAGSLEAHGTATTGNATLTSTGAEITIETSLGINCVYTTNGTDIGTLTGSATTKGKATLDIDSSLIPRTGHSAFCGSTGEWTGAYVVNSPSTLDIH